MKALCTLGLFLFLFSARMAAQFAPGIEWEKCLPNTSITSAVAISDSVFTVLYDLLNCNDSTSVGLNSYDGDGNLLWEKIYSPPFASSYHSFCLTKNDSGGYLISGSLIKQDSTFNWLMNTDSVGNVLFSRTIYFDSIAAPHFAKIIRDNASGFLFAGETYTSHLRDLLVVRLTETGDIAAQQVFGGALFDYMGDVTSTTDGGYIFAAYTTSNDFDVPGNQGQKDIWILKTDEAGNIQWSKCFGDTMNEEAHSIIPFSDGYLVGGMSQSNVGIVRSHHGTTDFYDYWILKIAFDGSLLWNKSFGGQRGDFISQIAMADDSSVVMTGSSYSDEGDITDHYNNNIYDDQWTMKMKLDSTVMWTKSTGGSFDDWAQCLALLDSNQLIIAGGTLSKDGDHHSACFSNDCKVINGGWIVKLNEHCPYFPTAKFSFVDAEPEEKEFEFTNESYNATNYLWDFGDGNTSTEVNPIHIYSYNGNYTVCLTAYYDTCSQKTICTTISTCADPVVANFHAVYPGGLNIQFNDFSVNAAKWSWDFGDGGMSNEENPAHLYSANGNYSVTLIVTDSCNNQDTITKIINTCNGFVAGFSFSAQFNTVAFTDLTLGSPESWTWFFGDNTSSTEQNPAHVYNHAGIFPVCLIVDNSACPVDTFCEVITIQCPAFSASFNYTADFNTIQFTDESENATSWNWNFGDGNFSDEQNPAHIYSTAGEYEVCLIANDSCSSDTFCQLIDVTCFAFESGFSFSQSADTVNFTDQSQNAIQWWWNFGDDSTSAEQNPQHIYADTGTYIVCMIAYDGCSYDTTCDTVKIYPLVVPQENIHNYNFSVHPNPASANAIIEFDTPLSAQIRMTLEDIHGKELEEIFNGQVAAGIHQLPLETSGFIRGVYILRLTYSSGSLIKKFVVQ